MFIYSQNITNRHRYVSKILEARLGLPFNWVTDKAFLEEADHVLVYSRMAVPGFVCIHDSAFLDGSDLEQEVPDLSAGFFEAPEGFSFKLDLFSAIFFVISRFEEYTEADRDEHGRFKPENSAQFKLGLLDTPVVDEWVYGLAEVLEKEYGIRSIPPKYRFLPTVDVDIAYAYLGRPFWLTLAGYLRDFKYRNVKGVVKRFRVNTGLESDPYDVYEKIKKLCREWGCHPHFFFQVGQRGRHDKNLFPLHPLMRNLIDRVSQWAGIGLHPSYGSNENPEWVAREKAILENITGKSINNSRQHYLKFQWPDTFSRLLELNITDDYSMGYAGKTGFRAGTCHPFPFFDLTTNCETSLTIHPFQAMDVTLNFYLNSGAEEAMIRLERLIETVRKNHGECVVIWHNSSFAADEGWNGWEQVFTHFLKCATP